MRRRFDECIGATNEHNLRRCQQRCCGFGKKCSIDSSASHARRWIGLARQGGKKTKAIAPGVHTPQLVAIDEIRGSARRIDQRKWNSAVARNTMSEHACERYDA